MESMVTLAVISHATLELCHSEGGFRQVFFVIFKCHINFVELKSCFTLSFLNVSLTGDLIRLQTCICRPLLLIHLYAALLITKSQAFGSIVFIVSLYCMEVCTCEVHVYFFFFFLWMQESSFSFSC